MSTNSTILSNVIGYNFRLGEIEAAIAIQQLKKLPNIIKKKRLIARKISDGLRALKGVILPPEEHYENHSFYILGINLDLKKLSYDRKWICSTLRQEGVECIIEGYQAIHLNPIFQTKIAYGQNGFPWKGINNQPNDVDYKEGICRVCEHYHKETFIGIAICAFEYTDEEITLLIQAFHKVWQYL